MDWTQNYTPLGSLGLSAAVAAVPVLLLLGMLGFMRVRAHWVALAALLVLAQAYCFPGIIPAGR